MKTTPRTNRHSPPSPPITSLRLTLTSALAATLFTASVASACPSDSASSVSAQREVSGTHFDLLLETPGTAALNSEFGIEVHLVTKNGKKVNFDYPMKLSIKEGSTWETLEVELPQSGDDETQAALLAKVRPRLKGQHDLSVNISFSVCTKERCLIEKETLVDRLLVR